MDNSPNNFMDETHPDAFKDFPKNGLPFPWKSLPTHTERCPRCHGYGGWNLKIGAYPLPKELPRTTENIHNYENFRASCSQCTGWGWVEPRDVGHVHVWDQGTSVHMHETTYRCTVPGCERGQTVDSSG